MVILKSDLFKVTVGLAIGFIVSILFLFNSGSVVNIHAESIKNSKIVKIQSVPKNILDLSLRTLPLGNDPEAGGVLSNPAEGRQ